jgi:hypothetical protein
MQPVLNKKDGTKKGQKLKGGGMRRPFGKLRTGYEALDFPMMPPRTGLEIILKAVFYSDSAPLALGIGNWMASRKNTCAIPNGGEGGGAHGSFLPPRVDGAVRRAPSNLPRPIGEPGKGVPRPFCGF